jgi:hypothetical protein
MFIPNYIICFHNIWVTYSYQQINHFQHYTNFEGKKSCISIALVLINVIAPSYSCLWIGIVMGWGGGWFFNLMHVLFTLGILTTISSGNLSLHKALHFKI